MSNRTIRRGGMWHEYSVCLHAGNHGEATKVRFSHRDFWVGDHYWYHIRSYKPSRKQRAFLLMSKFENRKRTDSLFYQIARVIVLTEMGFGRVAQLNLKKWKENKSGSNDP